MKILVIDDEVGLLEEIADWFTFEGYEVLSASSGAEGIELARKHLPDLVLCDIMMPDVDGYRVLSELRTNPATALTAFIFLSTLGAVRDVRRGMNLGADDYVVKPTTRAELLGAVRARLERDAAARQRAEATLDQLRAGMLMTLPHELRTPLVGIIGFGELLTMDTASYTPAEIAEMATGIVDSGVRLLRLIDHYLLFMQLELTREQNPFPDAWCDAHTVIQQSARQTAEAHRRESDLLVDVMEAAVTIDADSYRKLVCELVDNAFKFSRPGTPVTVTGRVEDGMFALRITDQGAGFAPDEIKRIGAFVQFGRKRREQQGSGLGLVIAKRLAERRGGALEIDSQLDAGTTVCVRIPLHTVA